MLSLFPGKLPGSWWSCQEHLSFCPFVVTDLPLEAPEPPWSMANGLGTCLPTLDFDSEGKDRCVRVPAACGPAETS